MALYRPIFEQSKIAPQNTRFTTKTITEGREAARDKRRHTQGITAAWKDSEHDASKASISAARMVFVCGYSIALAYKKTRHSIPAMRVSMGHTFFSSIFVSNRGIIEPRMHRH